MKLYYGGAEIAAWRDILSEQNIPTVSLSYIGLSRRTQTSLKGMFPDYQKVFLDSGGYTYNRNKEKYEFEDALEVAAQYMDFVRDNIGYVSLISEFDAIQLGTEFRDQFRSDFYNSLPPDKFMPIWHPSDGNNELERLCSTYNIVGVSQADIHGDTAKIPVFNSYIRQYGVRLHGVGITSKKLLEAVKWDSVSSTSWLSPTIYGDTFIWFGGKNLKRYPKDYKAKSRKANSGFFTLNGFDKDKILADDSHEVLRLSLWSWQNYITVLSGEAVTTQAGNEISIIEETPSTEVDVLPVKTGTAREHMPLPVMTTLMVKEETLDEEESVERPHIIIRSESMRLCDTCFLRDKCPGFKPGANCLYNIPIEIRTKEQLRSLHDALIEMQTHRVLFMKMAEDLSGGYADPNLSSEIDRLNRMIKTKVESDKSTFAMTITASESPSGPRVFDKFFGVSSGDKLRALEAPQEADVIIAEVLDEEKS